jgi:hypothetical protein
MVNLRNKEGRSLYFANRKEYYRRKRISTKLIATNERKRLVKEGKIYRQSVAYATTPETDVGITYRAVLYTLYPDKSQEARLKSYLDKRIKVSENWDYIGYEMEQVGENDIQWIELNKLYFEVDK